MNGKYLLIFVVSVAFFTLAAKHRFHDSAHAIGMIRKGGGIVRHPALLEKNRDTYILIATAGVMPPYHGNARVVLEGDPALKAAFHNSGPAVDLGIHRHPDFRDNTYIDLRPRDRIALWVRIKRDQFPAKQQTASAPIRKTEREAAPPCPRCEPEDRETATETSGKGGADTGSGWRGKVSGAASAKGPAVAFYDIATNEPILRIPIRFTGAEGGGNDDL